MDADYDPVAGFARAAESMAETQRRLEQTTQYIAQTQRLGLRLQGCALALLGLALLGAGWLIWQGQTHSAEHAALLAGLRADTQTLAAQTQALLELLRRTQP